MRLIETEDGVILEIYVKPKSSKFEVRLEEDEVVVRSTEEPERGKVNKEIVKEFTKLLHADVEIISGFASKQKRLLIRRIRKGTVEHLLLDAP